MNRRKWFLVGTVILLLVCASLYSFLPDKPPLSSRSPVCHPTALPAASPKEPYEDSDAYEVYSAIIPSVPLNPKWQTWFISRETVPHAPDVPTAPAPPQELITDVVNGYLTVKGGEPGTIRAVVLVEAVCCARSVPCLRAMRV